MQTFFFNSLRPSPFFFFRLLSNTFPDFGSVGRKRKKRPKNKRKGEEVWNSAPVPQHNIYGACKTRHEGVTEIEPNDKTRLKNPKKNPHGDNGGRKDRRRD